MLLPCHLKMLDSPFLGASSASSFPVSRLILTLLSHVKGDRKKRYTVIAFTVAYRRNTGGSYDAIRDFALLC